MICEVYINGLSCISAQNSFDKDWFFTEVIKPAGNFFKADESTYKDFLPANFSRRMSKITRMGVASAMSCMKDAGVENIHAVITGTGTGCFEDSEKFLRSMIENDEKLLSPSTFIRSTHNTVAAHISLLLKCHEYNFTYTHRGFSFESALQDTFLQIQESKSKNVLLGGMDEITPEYIALIESAGWIKEKKDAETNYKNSANEAIAGEGSAFFLLSGIKSSSCYSSVSAVKTIYKPGSAGELQTLTDEFLSVNDLDISDVDAVLLGLSGDIKNDHKIKLLCENYFKNNTQLAFKNFFGESPVAVSFALWTAAKLIKGKKIPEALYLNEIRPEKLKKVIILNQYRDKNYSLILVSEC